LSYEFNIIKELPEEIIPYVKTDLLIAAVNSYLQFLRQKLKHEDLPEAEHDALTLARTKLFETLIDYQCNELFE
jgi:hypothetical protein